MNPKQQYPDRLVADPRRQASDPQPYLPPPVSLSFGDGRVDGYAEAIATGEINVQALDDLPALKGECTIRIELPLGRAVSRGRARKVNRKARTCTIVLTTLKSGGRFLLAAALAEGEQQSREP